ncbi:hypothetical protein V8E54_002637 [Elaphomyces granulatus]
MLGVMVHTSRLRANYVRMERSKEKPAQIRTPAFGTASSLEAFVIMQILIRTIRGRSMRLLQRQPIQKNSYTSLEKPIEPLVEKLDKQSHLIEEHLQEVKQENKKQDKRYQNNQHRDCHKVFKTSTYEQHKHVNPDRVDGTCKWVLSHPQYSIFDGSQRLTTTYFGSQLTLAMASRSSPNHS